MKTKFLIRSGFLPAIASAILASALAGHATTITQTVNDGANSGWNTHALWGSPAAVPSADNDYVTADLGGSTGATGLGSSVTTRVRDTGGTPFIGNSLTIVSTTELLLKNNATTTTGNIILNGGTIRYAPSSGTLATLDGILNVASESYLGLAGTVDETLTVNSTLTGNSILHLAAGNTVNTSQSALSIIFGGDLSGFMGTFNLGGGSYTGTGGGAINATLGFAQDYNLSSTSLVMGQYATQDILTLDHNLTFGSLTFDTTSLGSGTYSASDLNTMFSTTQFVDGGGTLTIAAVPEPGTFAMLASGFGLLAIFRRRR